MYIKYKALVHDRRLARSTKSCKLYLEYPKWRPKSWKIVHKCHAPAAQHGVQVVGVPDMQLAERQGRVWGVCSVPPNQEYLGFSRAPGGCENPSILACKSITFYMMWVSKAIKQTRNECKK